jgi:hypothetical protein
MPIHDEGVPGEVVDPAWDEIRLKLAELPVALESPLCESNSGSPVELFKGHLRLRNGDETWEIREGKVHLTWLPSPSVRFEGLVDRTLSPLAFGVKTLEIPDWSTEFNCSITRFQLLSSFIEGRLDREVTSADPACTRVTFALCNTPAFLGAPIRDKSQVQAWSGRLRLEWQDWVLTFDELKDSKKRRDVLKNERTFGVVALGSFERPEGLEFLATEATQLLEDLSTFWSFLAGRWCGPILPLGYGGDLEIWKPLSIPRLRRWSDQRSCFDLMYQGAQDDLRELFHGFMRRRQSLLWSHPISFAIYWYGEANSDAGGAEGGLVLVQAALEMLSWVVMVEDPESSRYSQSKFKDIDAEVRLRELLQFWGIPTEIPPSLATLKSVADQQESIDGVGAIVWMRNRLIHPKRRYREEVQEAGGQAMVEANQLSLWFLELALLALMGYRGLYSDRFKSEWNWHRFQVPWVKSDA